MKYIVFAFICSAVPSLIQAAPPLNVPELLRIENELNRICRIHLDGKTVLAKRLYNNEKEKILRFIKENQAFSTPESCPLYWQKNNPSAYLSCSKNIVLHWGMSKRTIEDSILEYLQSLNFNILDLPHASVDAAIMAGEFKLEKNMRMLNPVYSSAEEFSSLYCLNSNQPVSINFYVSPPTKVKSIKKVLIDNQETPSPVEILNRLKNGEVISNEILIQTFEPLISK